MERRKGVSGRPEVVARKLKSDRVLFVASIVLVSVSVVMVYSASAVLALERFQEPYRFLMRQALWAALGLGVLSIAMRIDYRTYRNEAFIWAVLGVVGLMLAGVLFTPPVNGARRWLNVGSLGIQPSELAKIGCVLFAALMLERRMHRINEVSYSLTPIVIITGAIVGLIVLEPDVGTSLSLLLTIGVMIFAAGLSYRHLALAALVVLPTVTAVLLAAPYRRRRLFAFLDPWQDPLGDGFQIIQSRIAVGTGGVTGRGLMEGVQKLFYLPEPHTDFIYAVIAEELGLIGATAILICFCVIAWRGLRISSRADDCFGSLVALGLTTMIAVQAFVNMSVVLGLLPTKGIPLPLVSNGGSSLLVSLLGIGMLLNISQHEAAGT
jgi:cell division protein FtsW